MLVDFWTYTCINCIRTLPYTRAWDAAYRSRGLTIVGVHTPEFQFEHDAANVQDAIAQNRLRYPVAQDNDYKTWNAWGNEYWPAKYLIDAKGRVRYVHFGEGDDKKTEAAIRSLLAEAGAESLGGDAKVGPTLKPGKESTPETYLGSARAQGWVPNQPSNGLHDYTGAGRPLLRSRFAFTGRWKVTTRRPPRWRTARASTPAWSARPSTSCSAQRATARGSCASSSTASRCAPSPCAGSASTRWSRSRRPRSTS